LRWSVDFALWKIQEALLGVLNNLPNRVVSTMLRVLIFPLGARIKPPNDALGSEVARGILHDSDMRRRLTQDIFVPDGAEDGLGRLEAALELVKAAREASKKLANAIARGTLHRQPIDTLTERAIDLAVINAEEGRRIQLARKAQDAAIQVDSFTSERYGTLKG
jgi:acyl-CoA dehydrogenase